MPLNSKVNLIPGDKIMEILSDEEGAHVMSMTVPEGGAKVCYLEDLLDEVCERRYSTYSVHDTKNINFNHVQALGGGGDTAFLDRSWSCHFLHEVGYYLLSKDMASFPQWDRYYYLSATISTG